MTTSDVIKLLTGSFNNMTYLIVLYLHQVPVFSSLSTRIFNTMIHLTDLTLTNNNITSLHPDIFESNQFVRSVNLSCNLLQFISEKLFKSMSMLRDIDMSSNLFFLPDIPYKIFSTNHLIENAAVDNDKMCCVFEMSSTKCVHTYEATDSIGSCNRILSLKCLYIWMIVSAIAVFILNMYSFMKLVKQLYTHWNVNIFFLCNLRLADCAMSLYLSLILVLDTIYSNSPGYVWIGWIQCSLAVTADDICLLSIYMCTQ